MEVVILAGGLGTRLSEETAVQPKPMVTIGNKPIITHIMEHYSSAGFNDFVICCGYKGYMIKEFFSNYALHLADVYVDVRMRSVTYLSEDVGNAWKVLCSDTGDKTNTGGRVKRIKDYIKSDTFMLTYGDGLCDIDIQRLVEYHKKSGLTVTLTAVQPPGRYGSLSMNADQNKVEEFIEKPQGDNSFISGGFFVVEKSVLDMIEDDDCCWETEILPRLAAKGELGCYVHKGYWRAMDTIRDRSLLEIEWPKVKRANG